MKIEFHDGNRSGNNMDPFALCYSRWIDTLTKFRPLSCSDVWPLLVTFYRQDPTCFKLISCLHQNDEDDKLHFSLEYSGSFCSYRIHVYGFYKNDFIMTHATYTCFYNKIISDVKELVRIRPQDDSKSETGSE